jgi:hypothetical protein
MDSTGFFVGGSANLGKGVESVPEVKKCPLADSIEHVDDRMMICRNI